MEPHLEKSNHSINTTMKRGEVVMLAEMKPLLELLEHYFRETRKLVEGLSTEQLNWRPISGETQNEATNSLYGLAVHIALGIMQIAGRAAGKMPPDFPEL